MKLAYWKFYLFLAVVIGGPAAFFWHELAEAAYSGFHSLTSDDEHPYVLRDEDILSIHGVRIEPLRNNAALLDVKGVSITGHQGATVQLAVSLQSRSTENDFPNLSVLITGAGPGRTLEFAPSEYSHGDKLGKEPLGITLQIQPGERNFTVTPFYKGAQ